MTIRLPAFDVLVDMARNDPQGLETLRRSLTNAVIANAPTEAARRQLRGIQFRVDLECRRSKSPLGATIRISELMCRSLARLRESIVCPDTLRALADEQTTGATVIPMFTAVGIAGDNVPMYSARQNDL